MNDIILEPVRTDLLDRSIEGVRLGCRTLGEELGRGARLLVFLRHFG